MKTFYITASILAALTLTNSAWALPKKVCTWRADLIASVAVERDKGVPKAQVTKKLEKSLGPKASGIREYVDGVYIAPSMTPEAVWQTVYDLCIAE